MSLDESVTQLARKVSSLQDNLQHLVWSIKTPEDAKVEPPPPVPPDPNHNLVNTLYDRATDLSNQARPCTDLVIQLQQEAGAGKSKQKLTELLSQLHMKVKETRNAFEASPGLPEQREELKDKGEEDPAWLPWTAGVEYAIQSCERAIDDARGELLDALHDVAMGGYVSEQTPPEAASPQPQSAPAAAGPPPETAACPTTPPASDHPETCPADDEEKISKEPIEVKPEPCYGTVRVEVTCNDEGIPDVEVRLRGKEREESNRTNEDGYIEWTNVEMGSYDVILREPEDYDLDDVLVNDDSTDDDQPHVEIDVGDGTTTAVEFQLTSHHAEIHGRILEHRGGCDHPLFGVKIAISSRKDSACVTTQRDGTFSYDKADAPALYEVEVDPSVETKGSCGIPLSPANPTSLLVQTEAGQCYDVGDIKYVAVKGQISVGAVVDADDDDDQQIPLDGLTFVLRADGEDGPGTRLSGEGEQYLTFSNLAEGRYTVSVSGTPTKTKIPLRLCADPGGSVSVLVTPGRTFNLRQYFRFEPAVAEVQGSVVDHESEGPLVGVLLFLEPKGHDCSPLESRTDRQGTFTFPDVPPGPFRVTLASKTTAIGSQKWVLPPDAKGDLDGYVKSGEKLSLPALRLARDRHQIIAILEDEDGSGIADAALKIEDADGNLIANVITGKDGQVTHDVDREGTYYIVPVKESGEHLRRYVAEVHSTARIRMVSGSKARTAQQAAAAASPFRQVADDVTTFPILTESVNVPSAPSYGGAPQAGDAGSWNRLVEGTLKEVLGWRPKKDPGGVVAALTQSFSPKEAGGFTEWKWNPRTYTVQVQADMGAVTGAQASIYSRAKTSLDAAHPLLDGLTPLIPDADVEDIEASRSIVRSQLQELIRELGTEGGPRPSRIDQLFELLSGPRAAKGLLLPIVFDPDLVPGQLGTLRDRFGMLRKNVNTIDEEQNLTNFVILVDYVQTLRQSWESQRSFFDRLPHLGQQPYLGTQLVLVSRALAVVAESVTEVGFTMDSVFLGAAERSTIRLDLGAGESPLFVSELLCWIEQFASEEAPRLISDSGKDGVEAIKTTLTSLSRFTRLATSQTAVPAAFKTNRVQRAWIELADQIDSVSNLIIDIKR